MQDVCFEIFMFSALLVKRFTAAGAGKEIAFGNHAEFSNILAMFWKNTGSFWEKSYGSGYWSFLNNKDQRPRHYAVSGLIKDYFQENFSILEVGCGYAPIVPLLSPCEFSYLGIDLSAEVVKICEERKGNGAVSFLSGRFEERNFEKKFDVVLASEVLYYYPVTEIPFVVKKLLSCLSERGILVVTMNKNPKAWLIWFILSFMARPVESLAAMNAHGSKWRIRVFRVF